MQDASSRHTKLYVLNVGQKELIRREYTRLKLGGGQAYDRSSE